MEFELESGVWINEPRNYQLGEDSVVITTEPGTDLWQRTYYGFRNDNAPGLMFEFADNFTFSFRTTFSCRTIYDQCGVLLYIDSNNWAKASVEFENNEFSRLGSVVTNNGYSDWATTDIPTPNIVWYRLNRRDPDFLLESSSDGENFQQMRIFHLNLLGETSAEMGRVDPPQPACCKINAGIYACSPQQSTFDAVFDSFKFGECCWKSFQSE